MTFSELRNLIATLDVSELADVVAELEACPAERAAPGRRRRRWNARRLVGKRRMRGEERWGEVIAHPSSSPAAAREFPTGGVLT